MSDRALVAAIRPNVYASSTTGVKKSAVTTTAMSGRTRTTAPSSPCSTPTINSVPGPSGSSLATVSSSSPGGILQAQPPPRANWVSRTALCVSWPMVWVTRLTLIAPPNSDNVGLEVSGVLGGPRVSQSLCRGLGLLQPPQDALDVGVGATDCLGLRPDLRVCTRLQRGVALPGPVADHGDRVIEVEPGTARPARFRHPHVQLLRRPLEGRRDIRHGSVVAEQQARRSQRREQPQ